MSAAAEAPSLSNKRGKTQKLDAAAGKNLAEKGGLSELNAAPEDMPAVKKRPRILLVGSVDADSSKRLAEAAAAAAALFTSPATSSDAEVDHDIRTSPVLQSIPDSTPVPKEERSVNIRMKLGNTCDDADGGLRSWTGFVDIGLKRAAWVAKVAFYLGAAESENSNVSLVIYDSDGTGVFQSPPRRSREPIEIRVEVYWKPEFVETPRTTSVNHVLDFGKQRTERMLFISAKAPVEQSLVPESMSAQQSLCHGEVKSSSQPPAQSREERLFTRFRDLFRRSLLSNPTLLESRCEKLRLAAKRGMLVGPIVIASEQAEQLIQEVEDALRAAGILDNPSRAGRTVGVPQCPSTAAEPVPIPETSVATNAASSASSSVPQVKQEIRGILRSCRRKPDDRRAQCKRPHWRGDHCPGSMLEEVSIESFKEFKSLWCQGQTSCDDCGAVRAGMLHGGIKGWAFTRSEFSCSECLRKRGLEEAQLPELPRESRPEPSRSSSSPKVQEVEAVWRCIYKGGVSIRSQPDLDATRVSVLEYLQVFQVSEHLDKSVAGVSISFLKLADGRGWVFDRDLEASICELVEAKAKAESSQSSSSSKAQCEECGASIEISSAKQWHDQQHVPHSYCEKCWGRWHKSGENWDQRHHDRTWW